MAEKIELDVATDTEKANAVKNAALFCMMELLLSPEHSHARIEDMATTIMNGISEDVVDLVDGKLDELLKVLASAVIEGIDP